MSERRWWRAGPTVAAMGCVAGVAWTATQAHGGAWDGPTAFWEVTTGDMASAFALQAMPVAAALVSLALVAAAVLLSVPLPGEGRRLTAAAAAPGCLCVCVAHARLSGAGATPALAAWSGTGLLAVMAFVLATVVTIPRGTGRAETEATGKADA